MQNIKSPQRVTLINKLRALCRLDRVHALCNISASTHTHTHTSTHTRHTQNTTRGKRAVACGIRRSVRSFVPFVFVLRRRPPNTVFAQDWRTRRWCRAKPSGLHAPCWAWPHKTPRITRTSTRGFAKITCVCYWLGRRSCTRSAHGLTRIDLLRFLLHFFRCPVRICPVLCD